MKLMKKILVVALAFLVLFSTQSILMVQTTEADTTTLSEKDVKAKLDEFYQKYPQNTKWTGTYDGGKQCYGFAKMVVNTVFGKTDSKKCRTWRYDGTGLKGMKKIGGIETLTESNTKALMLLAQPGDVIQFEANNGNGHQHSMIVWDVNESGVTVYDCNRAKDTVKKETMTWKQLVKLQGTRRGPMSLLRADNAANYSDCYVNYPTHGTVQLKEEAALKNYACSKATYARSATRATLQPGEKVEVVNVTRNDRGNYWYEVVYKGERGLYVYSGNVTWLGWDSSDIKTKDVALPSGSLKAGKDVTIKATVNAKYNRFTKITGEIRYAKGGKAVATETTGLSRKASVSIKDTALKKLNITRLKACGQYVYTVKVTCEYAYADNNKLVVKSGECIVLSSNFSV